MNNTIRLKMRHRNRLHKIAKINNNPHVWHRYRILRQETVDLIREAKSKYIEQLENSLNDNKVPPDKWWKIAKSITNFTNKSSFIPPLVSNNQVFNHPVEKAEILNNHFANISTTSPNLELPQTAERIQLLPFSLSNIQITQQDVLDQINT